MVTKPQGRQTQHNTPYKPYIHRGRGRGHRYFPVLIYIKTSEGTLPSVRVSPIIRRPRAAYRSCNRDNDSFGMDADNLVILPKDALRRLPFQAMCTI